MTAGYGAALDAWDARASVRAKPKRVLDADLAEGQIYFRPEGVVGLEHRAVRARGPAAARALEVRRLYRYMDDIAFLETEIINAALHFVTRCGLEVELPAQAVVDAYKVITDEAYHAYVAVELKEQIHARTGVSPLAFATPRVFRRFEAILAALPEPMRPLAAVIGAIVNETLISLNLSQANDRRMHPAVRAVIADHAEDEAVHHRYFSALFEHIWGELDVPQRAAYGVLVPAFMRCFLEDDPGAAARDLASIGLPPHEVDDVLRDEAAAADAEAAVRDGARPSLNLFRRCGLLALPAVAGAFAAAGLLEGAA
jgi:para-aminobenzoate N-oxygenase AurF